MRRVSDTSLDTSSGDASNNQQLATLLIFGQNCNPHVRIIPSHDAFISL